MAKGWRFAAGGRRLAIRGLRQLPEGRRGYLTLGRVIQAFRPQWSLKSLTLGLTLPTINYEVLPGHAGGVGDYATVDVFVPAF